jgi:hypothetical protein
MSKKVIPFKLHTIILLLGQTTVAILGIVGNILASVILSRKEMRNAFNLLLERITDIQTEKFMNFPFYSSFDFNDILVCS